MAPNFQSSFIPKGPVTEGVFKKKRAGVAGILAVSLFVTSIVVSGAMYVYKGIVKRDIQNLETELAEAEQNIDKKTINEMTQFGKKLEIARSIVARHQVVSNFLNTLSSSTVSAIQFTDFNYGSIKEGTLSVTLKGKAQSYASIAQQEGIFSKDKYFKSVVFSNLTLAEKGLVSFEVAISVDPQMLVYSP